MSTDRLKPLKKTNRLNIIFLLASLAFMAYMIFYLLPYADSHYFFSLNGMPPEDVIMDYIVRAHPVIIAYIVLASLMIHKLTYLRSLNYPLYTANLYIGLCLMGLNIVGVEMVAIAVKTILIPMIAVPVSLYIGVKKDKKS